MEEFRHWMGIHYLQRECCIPVVLVRLFQTNPRHNQIFAAICLYYLFRVRRVSLSRLAKGPARIVDLVSQGCRRMFAKHAEPTPRGREAENNKAY